MINEVLFDSLGTAGADGTWQWVEIYCKRACQTDSWVLKNRAGQNVATFPPLSLPAGTYVVAMLGPSDPSMENLDPAIGPVVITAGLPFGDHIGVTGGAVRLVDGSTQMDAIAWGRNTGAEPFYNLGYGTGRPVAEGESIGRNQSSADTNTGADFAPAGGANAGGATPGTKNIVEFLDPKGVIEFEDTLVNDIAFWLSQTETGAGWLKVSRTSPLAVSWGIDPMNSNRATAETSHVFGMEVDGVPLTFNGVLVTDFTRAIGSNATSATLRTSGTLRSTTTDHALSIDVTQTTQGFHALARTLSKSSNYTWSAAGTSYPVSVRATMVSTVTGDTTRSYSDTRTAVDYGGLGTKTASARSNVTRVSDGVHLADINVSRSFPSKPPYPGVSQSGPLQSESIAMQIRIGINGLMEVGLGDITQYAHSVAGTPLWTLRSGETGSLSTSMTPSGSGLSYQGRMVLPVEAFGSPVDLSGSFAANYVETAGKGVTTGTAAVSVGSVTLSTHGFAIDPPLPQDSQRPHWQRALIATGTALTCVTGAVIADAAVGALSAKAAAKVAAKSLFKKLIPGVGVVTAIACACSAIGNY